MDTINPMEQMIANAMKEAVREVVREEIEAAFVRHSEDAPRAV